MRKHFSYDAGVYFNSPRRDEDIRSVNVFSATAIFSAWAALLTALPVRASMPEQTRVVYLPFEDRVKLREAWDLSVEIPRWFSQSVDTVAARDSALQSVAFDSTAAIIAQNGWKRREYLSPTGIMSIAARFDASVVVAGTVEKFKVTKRALSGDGTLAGGHSVSSYAVGGGSSPMIASLQGYSAKVALTVALYDGRTGQLMQSFPVDVSERDGGLSVWLPISLEHGELNYYKMAKHPFGSEYFHKNVLGAVMKRCSQLVREPLVARAAVQVKFVPTTDPQLVQGTVLDLSGNEVYINLGSGDHIMPGQILEILKPERPVLGPAGDTLGWVEIPVATVKVRMVKTAHFSQAVIVDSREAVVAGWSVRPVSRAVDTAVGESQSQ